ncbi:MAG: 30S ribosomal protein S12 methylthiotransferase RimO [Rhodothermaceae bacterium]|nr:30S ribosomal protein S12 methylthiotransferase RimO [Rhodothermaceae bacterium]
MKTRVPRIYVHTLGCSKNLVDSEVFIAQAKANAFLISDTPDNADVMVVNTCGFIEEAKQESINSILQGVDLKKRGDIKKLLVMGCLSQRYSDDLQREIPEVDRYFGAHHLDEILRELGGEYKHELLGEREVTTPRHYAYLKISEGCDNPCSFCAIPLMRGGHKSKSMDHILIEAARLQAHGVRELILIAQDLTYYGLDLYNERKLDELLLRLSDMGFDWIRLLYAYPAKFPVQILPVIRERENICNYLDMPIQHTNTEVLKSMRRGVTEKRLRELIGQIRDEVPGIRLRTTVIVGYPEETRGHFESMLECLDDLKFDRLGVFPYSQEDDTFAFPLGDKISKKEKLIRVKEVMGLQERISLEKNRELTGSTLKIMLDRIENGTAYGRTEFDTPEVDNEFIVQGARPGFDLSTLKEGEFYLAEVNDAEAFDLFGEIVSKVPSKSATFVPAYGIPEVR